MNLKISVILPTYNERENIIPLVQEIHNEIFDYKHEIIVADDNSPDGTFQALVDLDLAYLKPILRTENRGFANSIRTGIDASSGEILIIMDSDYNHQPKYLKFMIESIQYYDSTFATRFQYGGRMTPRSRHILSWLFNIFIRIVTKTQITDSLYGFFAIKKEVLDRVDFSNIFWGYGDYCIRLLFYLQRQGVTILQFPAINGIRPTGIGNSRFLKVFWQYFKAVIRLTIKERIRCSKK